MALTVVGLLTALPGRASAQDPPPPAPMPAGSLGQGFGEAGQLVISGEMYTVFQKVNNQGWAFNIQPAADYFIIPNVTIGGAVGFGIGNDDRKAFRVAPRAGFNFNFTEHVSIWGKAGITYGWQSVGGASASESYFNLFVPINYHIVPRVFVGVGPFYNLKMSGDFAATNYGFTSVVGAWW
jgi:hypothetical protein